MSIEGASPLECFALENALEREESIRTDLLDQCHHRPTRRRGGLDELRAGEEVLVGARDEVVGAELLAAVGILGDGKISMSRSLGEPEVECLMLICYTELGLRGDIVDATTSIVENELV